MMMRRRKRRKRRRRRGRGNKHEEECGSEAGQLGLTSLRSYRFVFIFGQLLHGFGAAPLVTLGTTFLDESVSLKSSPVYIGIFQTWFLIGPAIGFVLRSQLLSLHTDFITNLGLKIGKSYFFTLKKIVIVINECFLSDR